MPTPLLITRNDIQGLPRGGVSILYNLAIRADAAEVVVKPGRLPERRLTLLLTVPLLLVGVIVAVLVARLPKPDAVWLGLALGIGIGVGGAICTWGLFAFASFLQSLRSRLMVVERLTGRLTFPRADMSFASSDGLALFAFTHLEKGRRFGLPFRRRAFSRDTWVTEIGLITGEEHRANGVPRYTPLWQRRVSRWLTWAAPNSTALGVARQLQEMHELSGLPMLSILAGNPEPLLIQGVAWDPIRERTF